MKSKSVTFIKLLSRYEVFEIYNDILHFGLIILSAFILL